MCDKFTMIFVYQCQEGGVCALRVSSSYPSRPFSPAPPRYPGRLGSVSRNIHFDSAVEYAGVVRDGLRRRGGKGFVRGWLVVVSLTQTTFFSHCVSDSSR